MPVRELYQSSVRLTRLGFPNHPQHDSRWQTEGRLPWGLRLRCGRTFRARNFVAWRRGLRTPLRRAGCLRSQQCSTVPRGKRRRRSAAWMIRFNDQGPDGLINKSSPGAPGKLSKEHKAFLARLVEEGPIPAVHGVVRWRACDLIMRLHEEFGISVSDDTVYRALKELGFSHVSARPKAYKQDPEAMEAFKKTFPPAWPRSALSLRLAHR